MSHTLYIFNVLHLYNIVLFFQAVLVERRRSGSVRIFTVVAVRAYVWFFQIRVGLHYKLVHERAAHRVVNPKVDVSKNYLYYVIIIVILIGCTYNNNTRAHTVVAWTFSFHDVNNYIDDEVVDDHQPINVVQHKNSYISTVINVIAYSRHFAVH